MIIDTHVHAVSEDRVKHPLHPGVTGWSASGVTNAVEAYIKEMEKAGVDAAVLIQPNGTYGYDNSYQAESALKYAPRTVGVGILDPLAAESPDKLTYWTIERKMHGVRLTGDAEPDDARANALWQRAQLLGVPIAIAGGGTSERVGKITNMAKRFPGVMVTPDHMAGWRNDKGQGAALTKALVDLAALPNVSLKISTTSLAPFLKLSEPEKDLFKGVINAFTPQRMMWGSNYPASREGGYAAQLEISRQATAWLSEGDRRWFFGDAALKFWPGLKVAAK